MSQKATENNRELTRADMHRRANAHHRESTPAADPSTTTVDPSADDWESGDGRCTDPVWRFQRSPRRTRPAVDRSDRHRPALPERVPPVVVGSEQGRQPASRAARHPVRMVRATPSARDRDPARGTPELRLDDFALQMPGSNSPDHGPAHHPKRWKPVLAYSSATWPSGGVGRRCSPVT